MFCFSSFFSLRFVGLSEVILNYEELDINQCPGDRQLNAFASTSLCDSTVDCLPLALYGLQQGGYECQCVNGFHYPLGVQGPYRGKELAGGVSDDGLASNYPLCTRSDHLLQFPTWVSKNAVEFGMPNSATSSSDYNFNMNLKRKKKKRRRRQVSSSADPPLYKLVKLSLNEDDTKTETAKQEESKPRQKRFLDRRNNFEKLRDSIYSDQDFLKRKCMSRLFQDVLMLNEDDERFTLSLQYDLTNEKKKKAKALPFSCQF